MYWRRATLMHIVRILHIGMKLMPQQCLISFAWYSTKTKLLSAVYVLNLKRITIETMSYH